MSTAKVEAKVEIASGCIIGAGCNLNTCEQLSDNTVVYGVKCERRIQRERPPVSHICAHASVSVFPLTYENVSYFPCKLEFLLLLIHNIDTIARTIIGGQF